VALEFVVLLRLRLDIAPEPHDADGDAALRAVDQRLLQGIGQHIAAVALHFAHYNFCRPHQTLSKKAGKPTTPAMAAGLEDHPWSLTQLCELLGSN
jgi:hypothetical protein